MKKFLAFVIGTALLAGGASLAADRLSGQPSRIPVETLQTGETSELVTVQSVGAAQNANAIELCQGFVGKLTAAPATKTATEAGSSEQSFAYHWLTSDEQFNLYAGYINGNTRIGCEITKTLIEQ